MRKMILSVLLVSLFSVVAFAQTFYMANTANNRVHQSGTGQSVLGSYSRTTIFREFGSPDFDPNNPETGEGCSYPYQETCRGYRVFVVGVGLAKMISISGFQIKMIMPAIPSNGNYVIAIQSDHTGFPGWITTHVLVDTPLEVTSVQPFVQSVNVNGGPTELLVGTLYGWNGSTYVPIKSLTDGNPNPRTYGGLNTIVQGYYTGDGEPSEAKKSIYSFGVSLPFQVDCGVLGNYDVGVFVRNHQQSWTSGINSITTGKPSPACGCVVFCLFGQANTFAGFVWFQ